MLYQRFAQSVRGKNGRAVWKTPGFQYGGGVVVVGGTMYYVSHLEKVELTGRRRFMNVSARTETAAAEETYQAILQQYGNKMLPASHPHAKTVITVAKRLIQVSGLKGLDWEVHVIDSPEANAFVIPGGKIFVFSGLLPVAKTPDGLASVLGHEIGHQVARHTAEQMSMNPISQVLTLGLTLVLAQVTGSGDLAMGLGRGITTLALDNPYSRHMETEADYIGLRLMAQACYNPEEAKAVWMRMEAAAQGQVPQFLSTHPSNKSRIAYIESKMAEAKEIRASSNCRASVDSFDSGMRELQKKQGYAKF
ncbi:peptidase family M48-domain-containing protein [Protomyces lactucae-debilis]|uniref:Peptidase family M48-domain-containing protein n=1 Tax=Protomyces lactucae-debilis TaxID=2754530 RepID=A0A1Y2FDI4_PROLT|nr:peptidase family M48-domain-containing protein [Protomyces lactucae-debilis]ORY81969.1 peptidase family M48-domain-containing protein [Protomyces lactucae-debilis]